MKTTKSRASKRIDELQALTAKHNADLARIEREGCPCCGARTRRNSSLTGWVQCGQFGAEGFRADSSKPACGWQAFYR